MTDVLLLFSSIEGEPKLPPIDYNVLWQAIVHEYFKFVSDRRPEAMQIHKGSHDG
ncbi:hypothetical protein [Bacillus sp. LL01]|uniref:hypothetical protein n=1 Tax=Bacillus sp. LL01 TaxID=1665556 RepID=UPI000ACE4236|nr:hypothetical protein [Bacillus sp. LL01]